MSAARQSTIGSDAVEQGTLFARSVIAARDAETDAAGQPCVAAPSVSAASHSSAGHQPRALIELRPPSDASPPPRESASWLALLRAPSTRSVGRHEPQLDAAADLESPQRTLREADLAALLGASFPSSSGVSPRLLQALAAADEAAASVSPPPRVAVAGIEYTMPEQFGIVEPGVYRSAYPTPAMLAFLDALRLRTVINLLDRLPPEYEEHLAKTGVTYIHCAVKGNKAHCEEMDRGIVRGALLRLMDTRCFPVLVHCRSGKHRTGALIGCLRMLQRWPLEAACAEYVTFCQHKQREVDKQYIERFDPRTLADARPPPEHLASWLPPDCTAKPPAFQQQQPLAGGSGTADAVASVDVGRTLAPKSSGATVGADDDDVARTPPPLGQRGVPSLDRASAPAVGSPPSHRCADSWAAAAAAAVDPSQGGVVAADTARVADAAHTDSSRAIDSTICDAAADACVEAAEIGSTADATPAHPAAALLRDVPARVPDLHVVGQTVARPSVTVARPVSRRLSSARSDTAPAAAPSPCGSDACYHRRDRPSDRCSSSPRSAAAASGPCRCSADGGAATGGAGGRGRHGFALDAWPSPSSGSCGGGSVAGSHGGAGCTSSGTSVATSPEHVTGGVAMSSQRFHRLALAAAAERMGSTGGSAAGPAESGGPGCDARLNGASGADDRAAVESVGDAPHVCAPGDAAAAGAAQHAEGGPQGAASAPASAPALLEPGPDRRSVGSGARAVLQELLHT